VLSAADAAAFASCIEEGGVAVFPADTVYGLACDPQDAAAVARLYALKGRAPAKPAAVMWFDAARALAALHDIGPRTRAACERLLPGPVTLLLANPTRQFPLAAGAPGGAAAALGIRVPRLSGPLAALARMPRPVLQSSANAAGGPDARTVEQIPPEIRARADLVLDGGPLPGTSSTVIDLRGYEADGAWTLVREGALAHEKVAQALGIVGRR
jgi:L-threonylcarbamoyladenylate synthase